MLLTYYCHVDSLKIGTQLVWGELLFVCNVHVQASRRCSWNRFDMVHLLHFCQLQAKAKTNSLAYLIETANK